MIEIVENNNINLKSTQMYKSILEYSFNNEMTNYGTNLTLEELMKNLHN